MNKKVISLEIANSSNKGFTTNNKSIYYANTIREVTDSDVKKALTEKESKYYIYKCKKWEVGISGANGTGGKERDYGSQLFETQFAIALCKLVEYENEEISLVYGLPATAISNESIIKTINKLCGKYEVYEGIRRRTFTVEKIKVLAQPIGTLFSLVYDINGNLRQGLDPRKKYLIIDIGWGTTDLVEVSLTNGLGEMDTLNEAMSDYNRQLLNLVDIKYPDKNVRNLYKQLYDFDNDLREYQSLNVRGGQIHVSNIQDEIKQVNYEFAKRIYDRLNANGWDFSSYNNIILTGGGCQKLEKTIKQVFPKQYANDIILVDDPVLANVKGFYIFGRKHFRI